MKENNTYIFNCSWERVNYGAILTAYAIQKILNDKFNIASKLVYNPDSLFLRQNEQYNSFDKFKKQYLTYTKKISNMRELYSLNQSARTFITGSDQVFRLNFVNGIPNGYEQYFLDFADIKTKKIAISASFGVYKEEYLKEADEKILSKIKSSLQTFDAISVREKSGVQICKDLFNVQAEWIIDPVFILESSFYDEILSKSKIDFSGKIVSYFVNPKLNNKKVYKYLSDKYKTDVVVLNAKEHGIEEWLSAIKDCKLLVTDSFHGTCFSIIFNKPFACVVNTSTGSARYDSIFEMLEIDNQCISTLDDLYNKDCIFKIDYEKVNSRIIKERTRGLNFIESALKKDHKIDEQLISQKILQMENKICEQEELLTISKLIKQKLWRFWLLLFYKYFPLNVREFIRFVRKKF